jgi:hypothetical protein
MTKKGALTVIEQKRQDLLAEMTPALQDVTKYFEQKMGKTAGGIVKARYDMGSRLLPVIDEARTHLYGQNAMPQLAAYFDIPGGVTALYNLANFARSFDREFVVEQASLPLSNGRYLELGHFFQIMQVQSKADQRKLFAKVRAEGWSVNQLDAELKAASHLKTVQRGRGKGRGPGRNPGRPTSPAAGLQTAFAQAQKLDNYLLSVMEESVFEPLEEVAPADVDERLFERWGTTRDQLEQTATDIAGTLERMRPVEERLRQIQEARRQAAEQAAEALADADEDFEPDEPLPSTPPAPAKKAAAKKSGAKRPVTRKTAKRRRPAPI